MVHSEIGHKNISLTGADFFLECTHIYGGMAERFNATVLKTVVAQVTLSSNLSPSAMNNNQSQATEIFL